MTMRLPLTAAVTSGQRLQRVSPTGSEELQHDLMSDADDENDETMARNDNCTTTPYVNMEMGFPPPLVPVKDDDDVNSVTSELSQEGIQDVNGFNIVCMVILLGDMARGVVFPSLWHLVLELGGNEVALGYAVAAFSFGRMISNPIFGSWSILYGYKFALSFTGCILLFGTLLYAQAQNVGTLSFLILAQTVLGIGSGTLGVTRAFVADVTARHERTTYMAIVTAVQYCGFTVTPFIGAFFNAVLKYTDLQIGMLRINLYTAPAYFLSAFCIMTLYLVLFVLKDREIVIQDVKKEKDKKVSERRETIDEVASYVTIIGLTIYDCCILGCMLLNIATKGSISSFETLGVAYAESHFFIDPAVAGTIVALCGSVGVLILLSMSYLVECFTDIQLICGGLIIMAASIFSLTGFQEGDANPKWRYILAIFSIYSIGYPVGHTVVIALFSKIVGKRPQGTLMGWFASIGSFARIIFPITTGYIAGGTNVVVLFWILGGILTASTVFVLVSKRTLNLLSS